MAVIYHDAKGMFYFNVAGEAVRIPVGATVSGGWVYDGKTTTGYLCVNGIVAVALVKPKK